MICMTNGALLAMKYKDRRDVKMLTTAHSAKMVDTDKRTRDGQGTYLEVVEDGIFHIYSLAICIGYLWYKEHFRATNQDPNKMSTLHKAFRREIVKELITSSDYVKVGRRSLGASGAVLQRLTAGAGHFPEKIPKSKEGGNVPQKVKLDRRLIVRHPESVEGPRFVLSKGVARLEKEIEFLQEEARENRQAIRLFLRDRSDENYHPKLARIVGGSEEEYNAAREMEARER
ncbi:Hypp6876 [Branchiostoma lanceolatum]|uniref:Hypp6876 protein n=1 Tax=Branchiostoma lanceolatum TaxID=7740 RepID=A0A8J9YVQ5_BRALA|nr:Hypp6876 [Branchiostoma lanceolatum]